MELGFQAVGVCDVVPAPHMREYQEWLSKGYAGSMDYLLTQVKLKATPEELLPHAKSVIAVALNYFQNTEHVQGSPRIARYALGRDYHKVIRGKLRTLSRWISDTYPDARCRPCVDSAPIFERDYAHLAGLGFFGKNTMLIDPKRGSWFFIGLLLTTESFAPDVTQEGGCGTCRKCIDACPTGAIIQEGGHWQLDSRRCISYLTIEHEGPIDPQLQSRMGGWTFGCDVCQEVCPFNEVRERQPLRGTTTRERDFIPVHKWPNLKELVVIEDEWWNELSTGSPIRRTGIEGLRRNALINLQNEKGDSSLT